MRDENDRKTRLTAEAPLAAKHFSIGLSIAISIIIIVLIVIFSMGVADYFYVLKHPIALAEDDLGLGLVVMVWAGIAFIVSFIFVLLIFPALYKYLSNIMSRIIITILSIILVISINNKAYSQNPAELDVKYKTINSSTTENNIKYIEFSDKYNKYNIYPWEIIKIPAFKLAYKKMLGDKKLDEWIINLFGPARKNELIEISNQIFIIIRTCKPHECDTNKLLILYNPTNNDIYGLLTRNGTCKYYGKNDKKLNRIMLDIINYKFK